MSVAKNGPLAGVQVIEFAGIGPGPFACMLLSDLGARVIRIDRAGDAPFQSTGASGDFLNRGRESICLNLKSPRGVDLALGLIEQSAALVEGFRPGVMEKFGLGPEECLARNPALVYGRMTGWGQHGPLSQAAGHDINYIAITGALHAIGRRDGGPVPPLNLLGDFGGGSLYLALGVVAALFEARSSGQGQVVDAAITDGVISLMTAIYAFVASGLWDDAQRQNNMLDGGAPYYDTYQCADGKWVSIGSIEPQFFELLAEKLGADLGPTDIMSRFDKSAWPPLKAKIAELIAQRSQREWCDLLEGSDVCFAPVLAPDEVRAHPHNAARDAFIKLGGEWQPAPAPRFSRTQGRADHPPVAPGANSDALLAALGYSSQDIEGLRKEGVIS